MVPLTATIELTPAFVAEYRNAVPVFRWMRANGWDVLRLAREDRSIALHLTEVWNDNKPCPVVVVARPNTSVRPVFYPTTVRQAIDFLVVAGVLPVELASWATR